jgi:alanine dehydrogenase
VEQVAPDDYLKKEFDVPVFCQLKPEHYARHKDGLNFSFSHFTKFPQEYQSTFLPYTKVTDILITGHFWDPRSPLFFTREDMKKPDFRISVIADISCDINGPIPSTHRVTTISDPFYSYNPILEIEEPAFSKQTNITVMSIDNLPGELPRDASQDFGKMLMSSVLLDLLSEIKSPMIERATILRDGKLTPGYNYLKDFLYG